MDNGGITCLAPKELDVSAQKSSSASIVDETF